MPTEPLDLALRMLMLEAPEDGRHVLHAIRAARDLLRETKAFRSQFLPDPESPLVKAIAAADAAFGEEPPS